MSEPSHKKIIRADRGSRKRAVIIFAGALIVGAALLYCFQIFLEGVESLADESPQQAQDRLLRAFRVVIVAMVLGFLTFALYLLHLSLRTFRSEQFPPPGTGVIKDTELLTGERARLRGMVGLAIAAALAAFGLLLALYIYRMIQTIMTSAVAAAALDTIFSCTRRCETL